MPAPVRRTWTSDRAPDALLDRLRTHTAPIDGGFTLMYRLSGAGIVVRTLEAPETEHPFFGKVRPDGFSVALVPHARDVTPFHPIIRATIKPSPDGGSTLDAELAHHPNARTFAPVFLFGAVALAGGVALAARDNPVMLVAGLGLALAFAVFPTLQARVRFQQSVTTAAKTLAERLELQASA